MLKRWKSGHVFASLALFRCPWVWPSPGDLCWVILMPWCLGLYCPGAFWTVTENWTGLKMLGWGSCRNSPRALRKAALGTWTSWDLWICVALTVHVDTMGNHIKLENPGRPAWLKKSWHAHVVMGKLRSPWDLLQRVSCARAVVHCRSVAKSCPTICDSPGWQHASFPVLHYLLEFVQLRFIDSDLCGQSDASAF